MSKSFYITNERGFNAPYSLRAAAFSISRFFLSGKLLHTKKQTPAVLKAHRGLMAIPILFLFQGTTAFCIGTDSLMPCAQSPDEADGLFCRQNCKKPKDLL